MEGNALVGPLVHTSPELQGNGSFNYYRTKWLLLDAIDTLKKKYKKKSRR